MRVRSALGLLARELGAVILFVAAWQLLATLLAVPTWLVPQPTLIAASLPQHWERIGPAAAQTAAEAIAGFVGGNLLGLALAAGFARWRVVESAVLPVAIGLRSVPLVAIAPLLTLLLGFGPTTIVTMAVLITFFPAVVNGTIGLRAATPEARALFRVIDATEWGTYLRLRIPVALPFVFAAFKVSAPAAVLGAMIAEWTAANTGLGYVIVDAGNQYRFTLMWGAIVTATALAVLAFVLASVAERLVIRWPVETE